MNRSYGQYGNWNGGSFGTAQAALSPGMTITAPDEPRGVNANDAVAAGTAAINATAGRGRGKGSQALNSAANTAARTFATTAPLEAIPGVGTALHIGATAAAAATALIIGLRSGRLKRKDALALAKKAGINSAMHTYLARAVRWKQSKRKIERAQIARKLANKKGKGKKGIAKAWGKVKTIGRKKDRLDEKIEILDAVMAAEKAGAFDPKPQQSMPVTVDVPPSIIDRIAGTLGIQSQLVLPLGFGFGALVLVLLLRRPSRGAAPLGGQQ